MTVKELIEELKQLDENLKVVTRDRNGLPTKETVEVIRQHHSDYVLIA